MMSDEEFDQKPAENRIEGASQCEPGCNCVKTGLGTKSKIMICLLVAVAATAVLAHSFTRKAIDGAAQTQPAFASTAQAALSMASTARMEARPSWGEPLKDMASLNKAAARQNAVFLYLVGKGKKVDDAVKMQIEQAAGKAQTGGMIMGLYTLDTGSQDYSQITSQVPAPCVLAMVKGRGMSVVSGEITEAKLIQAIVAASRPSGCCPGGGASGCN